MTRKHFEAIAATLKRNSQLAVLVPEHWNALVADIAATCSTFNPGFDSQRFYEAAGYVFAVNVKGGK